MSIKYNLIPITLLGGSIALAGIYFYLTTKRPSTKQKLKKVAVPGLHNLGNTCYVNALLQGLASIPSFLQWLKNIREVEINDADGFLHELRKMIYALNDPEEHSLSASSITTSLAQHKWNISIGVEHDLHELLNVFVTTWEEELDLLRKSRLDGPGLLNITASKNEGLKISRKRLLLDRCLQAVDLDSKIRSPCVGLISTQLQCCHKGCYFKKVRQDRFNIISLTIPKASYGNQITIESLLRKYFCMEMIRGATCDHCKAKNGRLDSGLFKKQGICMLPQVLVIRMERVGVLPSGNTFKFQEHVDFTELLDMKDFCFFGNKQEEYEKSLKKPSEQRHLLENLNRIVGGNDGQQKSKVWRNNYVNGLSESYSLIDGGSFIADRKELVKYSYQLRAVSEHRGIPETGHFVTYRRGIEPHQNRWFLTNDTQIREVNFDEVTSAQAYMLYYERVKPTRWYSNREPLLNL